jgi:hypothetical protein
VLDHQFDRGHNRREPRCVRPIVGRMPMSAALRLRALASAFNRTRFQSINANLLPCVERLT